ncbi:hypothetical protein V8918_02700 [Ralstonia mannitolilytica]|uniref:hypothetical protein n=1 Tax=Ralstonia mannitolilytica TaxID=105219 RepID=UPI003B83CFA3
MTITLQAIKAEPGADEPWGYWLKDHITGECLAYMRGKPVDLGHDDRWQPLFDRAAHSGQRSGVAEPEGWREFITEVAQQKPEKPDHWSPCGQCRNNAERAQDLIAAPTQQQEGV